MGWSCYNSLLKLKKTIVYEESEEEDPSAPTPEGFEQQVHTMLSLLSKLDGPHNSFPLAHSESLRSLTFTSMAMGDLIKLNITFTY